MTINLSKGQGINLSKDTPNLNKIIMGLGWDVAQPAKSGGFFSRLASSAPVSIDLDASVVGFDAQGQVIDQVWFQQLRGFGGAVEHTGDNRTGDGDGDDEQIIVNLNRLDARVQSLVFTVCSFVGQSFDQIENAVCRLVDGSNNKELARIDLSAKGSHTGLIMAKVYRENGGWAIKAIADTTQARTLRDMGPQMRAAL